MSQIKYDNDTLPDIQNTKATIQRPLSKVGISNFKVPIKYAIKGGDIIKLETIVSMYVDLNEQSRGINMSRLPRILYKYIEENKDISTEVMEQILYDFKTELNSEHSYLKFRFNYPIRQRSLKSELLGWAYYPVVLEACYTEGVLKFYLTVDVMYSSTCPCSAELCKHLEEQGSKGYPHSQRSIAKITVQFDQKNIIYIEDLIQELETILYTPVQVIVKRIDEENFAEKSAQNLKFCEDAARLISDLLDKNQKILDWVVVCEHMESLHFHDVIAINYKGTLGGLR